MQLIDADALAPGLDPLLLVEALRAGHATGDLGTAERLLLEEDGNAALTWVAWRRQQGLAVKTATVFPGNARGGRRPNIQSVVLLFDAADGAPLAAIHGESFTRMKTAADSALAADLLARRDAATLAVLGAGAQAETHIRFLLAVRPTLTRILIWNRSPAAAAALAARLPPGATVMPDARSAVAEAAIVTCLTAATTPVLEGAWLAAGTHVDLVGGYTPAMRESDDTVMRRGRLFADTRRFGVLTCGDYVQPIAAGAISAADVAGDLFDLCAGRAAGRRAAGEITVFKNGGGGHLDLMIARALYDRATGGQEAPAGRAGRGTRA